MALSCGCGRHLDDDPEDAVAYRKGHGYAFPALMGARPFVDTLVVPFSVPRNWLVDTSCIARQESVGFDHKLADWPQAMLRRLAGLSANLPVH